MRKAPSLASGSRLLSEQQQQRERPQPEYTYFCAGYTNLHAVRQRYRDAYGEDCFARELGIGHNSETVSKKLAA